MTRWIKRRDFLNGAAIGTGGLLLAGCNRDPVTDEPMSVETPRLFSPPDTSAYYPPTLTGMRGSHEGSYEVAHELAWRGIKPERYEALNEHYDLIVVGAGMSGLAAARYYQQKMGDDARILILDNHDDFGGHAKRNEFHQDGRMMLSLGGAQNIEALSGYSDAARRLMEDIGIDDDFIDFMNQKTPEDLFLAGELQAENGIAMPGTHGHVTVRGNWLASMFGGKDYEKSVRALPLPAAEQDKLIDFFAGHQDFLEGFSLSEKWEYINTTSYNRYLVDKVGLDESTLPIMNAILIHLTGVSGWNMTVLEGITMGGAGIKSMGWMGKATAKLSELMLDNLLSATMFPDGNASVARLLVQKLIPAVAPSMQGTQDVAIARFDYSALDQENHTTRLRLSSTAVGVRDNNNNQVEVDYVQQGKALRVTADHCVLACYNALIPHLCPEMSEEQKEGLSYGVKTPFVYANVQLKNGQAYSELDTTWLQCPYDLFQWVSTSPTVAVGGYEPPRGPDDPMVVFMMHSPMTGPEQPASCRDQLRMARHTIYSTPFDDYEQQIRQQMQSLLGKHGFNHETDIRAITVNRIPHGYAYAYLGLYDPEWEEGQAPHEIGRAQFGRISIANTDSEATALMNLAFDAAWRAVEEQTA